MTNAITESLKLALHFMRHAEECPASVSKAGKCTCGFDEAERRVRRKIEKCEAYDESRRLAEKEKVK